MCDIHKKKSGTVPLRKEAKRCGSPHKIRVMYERKGNNKEVLVDERALCESHARLIGTVPLEN